MSSWSTQDIPDLTGRTVIVTGANSGIGRAAADALAAAGGRVVLAVRDTDKGQTAAAAMRGEVEVRRLDLANLASVREFAAGWQGDLDLLINNAGVMIPPHSRTADGFELQFGTNHLGHFALTNLLLPQVTGRVVTVSSAAHRTGTIDFDDLNWERKPYRAWQAYSQSKLANLLFTYELQRRLSGAGTTIAVAAHPGLASTELTRNSPAIAAFFYARVLSQNAAMGALPVLRAATDPGVLGGQYYGPGGFFGARGYPKLAESSKQSHDTAVQRRLWTVSEQLTGVTFPAALRPENEPYANRTGRRAARSEPIHSQGEQS
jgi:NAD(P)-dependent dehydrogenase (short-subunit alcohol dehydrogenase family)